MDRASIMRDGALSTFSFSRRGIHTIFLQSRYSRPQKMREGSKGGQRPHFALDHLIGANSILAGKATWFHCVSISEANE